MEQRLAKWLLGVRDRVDTDEFELRHDFIGHMLGIRRSAVTMAVGELAKNGLVSQQRSVIRVADREGLTQAACECYGVMRDAASFR